jgi:hypothetical protein
MLFKYRLYCDINGTKRNQVYLNSVNINSHCKQALNLEEAI